MKTSEIRMLVERRVFDQKIKLTQKFVRDMSPKLLGYCQKEALRIYGGKYPPWWAILYKVIYKDHYRCRCGSEKLAWQGWEGGLAEYCSCKCAGASPDVLKKREHTCQQKYGTKHVQSVPSIRAKFKQSMVRNQGVEYTAQSPRLKKKMRKTLKKNHGVEETFHSMVLYGKAKATMLQKYGAEHNQQVPHLFEQQQRSGFKIRTIKVNGKRFRVRGGEGHAIKYLVHELGCSIDEIYTTAVQGKPSIPWYDNKNKYHIYHPDIYAKVKGRWFIIEVKSTYTAGITTKSGAEFYRLRMKAKGVEEAGYNFRTLLVHYGRSLPLDYRPLVIKDIHQKTRKQVRSEVKLHRQRLGS